MKTRQILTALLAGACFLLSAGTWAASQENAADFPEAEGDDLLEYISEENPYQQWSMWPGKEAMYPGQEPHGALLTTYVNEPALRAIEERSGQMPNGAIIVKENYTPERQLAGVTVMYKKTGFAPEAGDWFWLKYSPEGQIEEEGQVQGCIGCHSRAANNDYLFTGNIGGGN